MVAGPLAIAAERVESNPGECVWTFSSPHGRYQNIVYPQSGKNGVFLVSNSPDYDGHNYVYHLNPKTGAIVWEADLGDVCCSEPALGTDKLVVTTTDRLARASTTFCLNTASGSIRWRHDHDPHWRTENVGYPYQPVICGDKVALVAHRFDLPVWTLYDSYRGCNDTPDVSRLICLELDDGYPVLKANDIHTFDFSRLSSQLDGHIYFGMYKIAPGGKSASVPICSLALNTGKVQDEHALPFPVLPPAPLDAPAIAGGRLYIFDLSRTLTCFELGTHSKPLWSVEPGESAHGPAAFDDRVVMALQSGHVVCYRGTDGKELWKRYVDSALEEPIIHNGQVVVCSRQNVTTLRLDNGTLLWDYFAPKPVLNGRPSAVGDVVLIPTAFNREHIALIALKIAEKLPPP
jgi:outer membrane protein assembly factor BamB